jgi:hypothetical protein
MTLEITPRWRLLPKLSGCCPADARPIKPHSSHSTPDASVSLSSFYYYLLAVQQQQQQQHTN